MHRPERLESEQKSGAILVDLLFSTGLKPPSGWLMILKPFSNSTSIFCLLLKRLCVVALVCVCHLGCERHHLQVENDNNSFQLNNQEPKGLTPQQQYAGEILSYLIKVVCGADGPIKNRDDWKSAGLNTPLDFQYISEIMKGTGRSKKEVISLDANILGLGKILYNYNPKFNLFKGNSVLESVYPSSELIALRLLLVKRMHRNEKINLSAIIKQKPIFMDPNAEASSQQLIQTGLTQQEFAFFQSVLDSEPILWQYLEHPFIVKTLLEMGAIENDPYLLALTSNTTYKNCLCQMEKKLPHSIFRIAVLPSFMSEFENGEVSATPCKKEFIVPNGYLNVIEKLKKDIVTAAAEKIALIKKSQFKKCVNKIDNTEKEIKNFIAQNISYFAFTDRPLMIYPGNVEAIKKDLCRDIDMTIVLLGKDVYLSIQFDENVHSQEKNHIFLDFSDTKYSLISDELDIISQSILTRIIDNCSSDRWVDKTPR